MLHDICNKIYFDVKMTIPNNLLLNYKGKSKCFIKVITNLLNYFHELLRNSKLHVVRATIVITESFWKGEKDKTSQ